MEYGCKSFSELIKEDRLDYQKILARKRRKRKAVKILLITVINICIFLCTVMITVLLEEKFITAVSEEENTFLAQVEAFEQHKEAEALMQEAVKAQKEVEIRAESFFSTMREMNIEGKLSVKLAKISDNLNSLSALTEQPKKAKELEAKIASQIEKLKQDLAEYPTQFGSLKLSLKSERKRLKACQKLRKEYEEARRKAKAAEEARKQAQKQQFARVAGEEMLLAQIIQKEAGRGRSDKIYVGSVILNRVRTTYIDFRNVNTISEVLNQTEPVVQYDYRTKEDIHSCKPEEETLEVAHGLLTGEIPCLEEKILFQTTGWQSWMSGQVAAVQLSGAEQFYGYPIDFEEKCQ